MGGKILYRKGCDTVSSPLIPLHPFPFPSSPLSPPPSSTCQRAVGIDFIRTQSSVCTKFVANYVMKILDILKVMFAQSQ